MMGYFITPTPEASLVRPERGHGRFELRDEGIIGLLAVERFADADDDVERHEQGGAARRRLAEPLYEHGHHRHLGPRFRQMSDAFFEGLQRLRLAACPFREDHQDLAAVWRLLGEQQRIAALLAAAALYRDDADDLIGEPAA